MKKVFIVLVGVILLTGCATTEPRRSGFFGGILRIFGARTEGCGKDAMAEAWG